MMLLLNAESPQNPEAHDRTLVMARWFTVVVDDHFVQLSGTDGTLQRFSKCPRAFCGPPGVGERS
jgi:hypothetical protein